MTLFKTVLCAALFVMSVAGIGCGAESDDVSTPSIAGRTEAPDEPMDLQRYDSLCVSACNRLEHPACELIPQSDLDDPSACLSVCKDGAFTLAELECLARLECGGSPEDCF